MVELNQAGKPVVVTVVNRGDGVQQMVAGDASQKMIVYSKMRVFLESTPDELAQNSPVLYIATYHNAPTVFVGTKKTCEERARVQPITDVIPLSSEETYSLGQIFRESGEVMVGEMQTVFGMRVSAGEGIYSGDIAISLVNGKLLWARKKG